MGWGGRHTTSLLRCTDLPHARAILKLLWKKCKNYPSKCKNWGEGCTFIKPILSCTFMYLKQKTRVCATDSVGKGTFITKRSNCPSSLLISYPQNVFRVILKKVLSTRGKVPKYRKEKYSRKCLLFSPSNKGETCLCQSPNFLYLPKNCIWLFNPWWEPEMVWSRNKYCQKAFALTRIFRQ